MNAKRSRWHVESQSSFAILSNATLVTDFWSPYDTVVCADKQKCWPYLLRDTAKVSEKNSENPEWKSFSRRLVSIFRDSKKLRAAKGKMPEHDYDLAVARLKQRLAKLGTKLWEHHHKDRS